MEDLSMKVPLMNRIISKKLDGKTLVNFKESSRGIGGVMTQDRSYWIRILNKHSVNQSKDISGYGRSTYGHFFLKLRNALSSFFCLFHAR